MKRTWLITCRLNYGLTKGKLAKLLQISEQSYIAYELGTRTPKPIKAKAIGEILGFDWTKFYE